MIRIGVDFGGSKIEAAALDAEGRFVSRRRRPDPGGYAAALAAVRDLVANVEAAAGSAATVGVDERLPGAIRPHVFADAWRARIAPARWGDSSGVRGAAWLWEPAGACAQQFAEGLEA